MPIGIWIYELISLFLIHFFGKSSTVNSLLFKTDTCIIPMLTHGVWIIIEKKWSEHYLKYCSFSSSWNLFILRIVVYVLTLTHLFLQHFLVLFQFLHLHYAFPFSPSYFFNSVIPSFSRSGYIIAVIFSSWFFCKANDSQAYVIVGNRYCR